MSIEQLLSFASAIKSLFPERYQSYLRKSIKTINETRRLLEGVASGENITTEDLDRLHTNWDRLSTSLWLFLPNKELSDIKHDLETISLKVADLEGITPDPTEILHMLETVKRKIASKLLEAVCKEM